MKLNWHIKDTTITVNYDFSDLEKFRTEDPPTAVYENIGYNKLFEHAGDGAAINDELESNKMKVWPYGNYIVDDITVENDKDRAPFDPADPESYDSPGIRVKPQLKFLGSPLPSEETTTPS